MAIKKYKPTTPAQRFKTSASFDEITKTKPEKSLTVIKKRSGGRNNQGRITMRFRGGGHKRQYRIIDFKRNKKDIPASVEAIEYDPNRSARIALLSYADGEKRYILAPDGLKTGDTIIAGTAAEIKVGNALPLEKIPLGIMIHNIELYSGKGGQIARSAGVAAQLVAKEEGYGLIKMPSGELRKFKLNCFATVGQVSNQEHINITIGKAGRQRWVGKKGHVRGCAMNPVDHPMGGGEGKKAGGIHPVSPWGQLAKGKKTRKKKKKSDVLIVKKRK